MSSTPFDPKVDGWSFKNFTGGNFTWDLFRKTYLGVNPTENSAEAPLDCAYYELFQQMASGGNCGGMSLLALALYKFGGFMGFCSPAIFYSGDALGGKGPDDENLRTSINILQARQFNEGGIRNFLDLIKGSNLNNALYAWTRAQELIAEGDLPVLSIAATFYGTQAHTLIPYAFGTSGSEKYMYLWDPNNPYNPDPYHNKDGNHYDPPWAPLNARMRIWDEEGWEYWSSTFDWIGPGETDFEDKRLHFEGSGSGWCFVVPLSKILQKSRHPLSVGLAVTGVMTIFVTGTGAVRQITDGQGRRLYKTDADVHVSMSDFETDEKLRLPACGRWPWMGSADDGTPLPEVYFFDRPGVPDPILTISLSGTDYHTVYGTGSDLIDIRIGSESRSNEFLTLSNVTTPLQSVRVDTTTKKRSLTIRQTRIGSDSSAWRTFEIRNLELGKRRNVTIDVLDNFQSVLVSGLDHGISFDLKMETRKGKKLVQRDLPSLSTKSKKILSIRPVDWSNLRKTAIEETMHPDPRLK